MEMCPNMNSGKLFTNGMFQVASMSAAACLLAIGYDKTRIKSKSMF